MKSYIKIFIIIITGLLIIVACEKDKPDNTYQGPLMVEFVQVDGEFNDEIFVLKEPVADVIDTVQIQFVGPQQGADKIISFSVDASSTAIENVHYSLPANTITIPKGSSTGNLLVTVLHSGFAIAEEATLVLTLDEDNEVKPIAQNNTFTVLLFKKNFCPYERDDIIGTWDITEYSLASAHGGWTGEVTITAGEGDTILIDGLWWGGPGDLWGEPMIQKWPTKFIFDTSDEADPQLYIPYPQLLNQSVDPNDGTIYTYGIMQTPGTTGTYEYCDQELIIYYDEVYNAQPTILQDRVMTIVHIGSK